MELFIIKMTSYFTTSNGFSYVGFVVLPSSFEIYIYIYVEIGVVVFFNNSETSFHKYFHK